MKRAKRLTPEFLKDLREKRIAVVHPNDADGAVLLQQLQRIGCQAQAYWPPPEALPANTDIVFCAVLPKARGEASSWPATCEAGVIIAIIGYENPTIFDDMLQIGASAVMTTPIRSTGVLAALVMSLGQHQEMQELRKRIARLEQKLSSVTQITEAKAVLMRTRGITDAEAYRVIREQAMSKRVAIEEIARAIVHANALLSG